ncbi:hypothetical protein C6P40_002253 [Pichia californica]|uniref:Uncharacterized protein n=1 Tax=Pichia californica TaxID=460514 RepID=A0A9P6WK02_9ASCO|nr:hypothetical protein C6P42_001715 [[Candida] californica]KAG0687517.1 hypothetical protein C6P40_002253 [[Candida] californica]
MIRVPMEIVENNGYANDVRPSARKILAEKDVNVVSKHTSNKLTNVLTVQELEQRAKILRRRKNMPLPGIPISDFRGIQKRDHNHDKKKRGGSGGENILQNLDKLREKMKQNHDNNPLNKLPSSTIRPGDWILDNPVNTGSFTSQLQRILDAKRSETSRAIIKKNSINLSNMEFVGTVQCIQVMSDSLKIVEVIRDKNEKEIFKIGLVALWNEWVDIKKGDSILFEDVTQSLSSQIQWSLKWKKLVG